MKIIGPLVLLAAATIGLSYPCGLAEEAEPALGVDLHLDQQSAVKIAEVVLVAVYGRQVLKERPWVIKAQGEVFIIEGTLPPGYVGGVAYIEISRRNAQVIKLIHGK